MGPLLVPDPWFGTPQFPHTTSDLKELKTCLVNGTHVAFRRDANIIWLRQGPGDHQRTNHYGVVLSVISLEGDVSDLAKQINKDTFIYLMKAKELHTSYASFDSYKYDSPSPVPCDASSPTPTTSVTTTGSVMDTIRVRGTTALSYGGGIAFIQSIWFYIGRARWLSLPFAIPISVAIVALAGFTPSDVVDLFIRLTSPIASYAWVVFSGISMSWLLDPWLWFLPVIGGTVWICRQCNYMSIVVSDDSAKMIPPPPVQVVPLTPASPVAPITQPNLGVQSPAIITPASQTMCMANLIW